MSSYKVNEIVKRKNDSLMISILVNRECIKNKFFVCGIFKYFRLSTLG